METARSALACTCLAVVAVSWGCEATGPATGALASAPAPPPNVYVAPGGFLRFSDDLAMVIDGVMVQDSAAAVAMRIHVESGAFFPMGTLSAQEAEEACGVGRPVAFVRTSRASVEYSSQVPDTCRPID